MQVLITHGNVARTRVFLLNRWQIAGGLLVLLMALMLLSGTVYHFVFVKAVREGWPVVSQLMKLVVRDEFAQRDRFMRENLDAMAQKVGEMQAKLVALEAMSDRVSGLAGVKPEEIRQLMRPAGASAGGQGGPYVPPQAATLEQLNSIVESLDQATDLRTDLFTMIESRLLEGPIGSGFGFRSDPFTGRAALHTGLDFPADTGTPINAAAGGVVLFTEGHPQYGNMVEIDHGRGLVTRYAHTSKVLVRAGDIVRRGQPIALVGTSGRSTGPHLHFEVLVDGVPQNPAKFLALTGGDAGSKAGRVTRRRAERVEAAGGQEQAAAAHPLNCPNPPPHAASPPHPDLR